MLSFRTLGLQAEEQVRDRKAMCCAVRKILCAQSIKRQTASMGSTITAFGGSETAAEPNCWKSPETVTAVWSY